MKRGVVKVALLAVLAGGAIALYFSPLRAYLSREHIHELIDRLRVLWYAPALLIAAYAIASVFAIPASIFVIAAGVIWGWKLGAAYALAGGFGGAVLAYFVGRFLGEGLLERFGSVGAAVRKQVETAGFSSMLIVRLIPGPPFAVWNYAAGIARMPFRDYAAATFLGIIPSHIVFAYCADSLINGSMSEGDAIKRLVIVCALLLALVAIPMIIKRRLRPSAEVQ